MIHKYHISLEKLSNAAVGYIFICHAGGGCQSQPRSPVGVSANPGGLLDRCTLDQGRPLRYCTVFSVHRCSWSGMFILDPGSEIFHPGSRIQDSGSRIRIHSKEFNHFKCLIQKMFLGISRKYDQGCSSRIRILIFYPFLIQG